ncbi:ABC transporter substrate-binding protein [Enterovirga sp.]|jgi:NitT/TauT family transport system substrate-binding protein|uniref:ABC transporter substrate-binding protein n=1 Tax=Enterovirga sp. TaxID=2026350 RepID=UPI00261E1EA0|nr:ABC transporter substrate-binding protein [Enterovirga sp.]MDB5590384.1 transporter permease [Enterovirga sp.]
MRTRRFGACLAGLVFAGAAAAQDTKVSVGISGWTGFGPLTLAREAGIFRKHGLDVTLKKIPQTSRHLALASNDIQCAATTVETWIVWQAAGVTTRQIFQIDKSNGADGIAVRAQIGSLKELKGKSVAASPPGTSPHFLLAWMLAKNGMTTKDVTIVNLEPGPATDAFIAGQNDAVVTYEPYLSALRARPEAGRILATTLDYPVVVDTFGCMAGFLDGYPKAAKALADSYFEALEMIAKDPAKAYGIMGADVKQSAEAFGQSAKLLRWQDRAANKTFFASEHAALSKEVADVLLQAGVIKRIPDLSQLADPQFIR